ncbi:MAG: pitrilysin family protein [Chitinophagaceae bacterium]
MLNRTIAPPIKNAVDFNLRLQPFEKYTLDNGVEVYTINAGEESVMQLELVFAAGNCFEKENIVAAATNHLLKNGTTQKTAFEFNEHFEFYGSFLNRTCGNETASVSLHTLSKNLNVLLPAIAEMLTEANFPEEELSIFKQNSKQKLSVNLMKCDFVANRLIDAQLYGEHHPYGRYTHMEDFETLTREKLVAFYNEFYVNGRCIIFAAGKLPADFIQQLNKQFGKLNLTAFKPAKQVTQIAPMEQIIHRTSEIINDEKGVQGAIRIARNFPNRHHPDFQKMGVLNNLFGGFFGSRLMANVREDKGYTYGIHSYFQNHIEQSCWMVSTEAGRDVCAATIKEVYYEMEILREEPVDEEELLLVKNFMIGSILGDLDGPFQVIGRWRNYILNGTDESYFYSAINNIKTVTTEELQELANKYLLPEYFYELVVV